MASESPAVTLSRSEAILAVADVVATVRYYRDKLGFTGEWLWGEPPTFAGVTWGKVGVLFCLQPALAARIEGHQHSLLVSGIDRLYEQHCRNHVEVVSSLDNKPWGLREYTVRDPNGYHLRFGEPITVHATSLPAKNPPENVRMVERLPTVAEYEMLIRAVGWAKYTNLQVAPDALQNTLYSVLAMEGDQAVGMARLVGDGALAFYVQDVMVLPAYQRKGIGTALMKAVMSYFQRATPRQSSIGLFTGRNLAAFYEQLGFEGTETSLYGMYLKKWDAPPARPE
ncbi:MAG TPA: GNAT family N-acetyltransferase [Gemmataceae bacterium]|jgi:GNAT superfamily N-acetyltransferase|nr:GNAT family N-acetyltransferase [Gemmataceae bacterium]